MMLMVLIEVLKDISQHSMDFYHGFPLQFETISLDLDYPLTARKALLQL